MAEPFAGYPSLEMDVDVVAGLAFAQTGDAGPAGTAGLVLDTGIELDIDVARPTRLVGLTVDLPARGPGALDRNTRRRLEALLGRRGDGLAPALHRAALAYAVASEVGAAPVVNAGGRLEAALELATASPAGDMRHAARHDARLAVDLLLDLAEEGRLAIPERASSAVAGLVRAALDLDGRRGKRPVLRARAAEIERGDFTPTMPRVGRPARSSRSSPTDSSAEPASAADEASGAGGPRVDVRALPGAVGDASPVVYRSGAAEVEVRIHDWAAQHGDLWARAFHARDDVLLAVARFRPHGPDMRARLLVPPDDTTNIEVDVTDRPELPRPSATLCAVQRAAYHGRLAARAERLGQAGQATRRWQTCAGEWMRAGDRARARQAALYAREPSISPWPTDRVIAPLVSDLLASASS